MVFGGVDCGTTLNLEKLKTHTWYNDRRAFKQRSFSEGQHLMLERDNLMVDRY